MAADERTPPKRKSHGKRPSSARLVRMIAEATFTVERIDMTDYEQIVAVCTRGKSRQRVPILDLPLPDPPPAGAEWIDAYRRWARGKYPWPVDRSIQASFGLPSAGWAMIACFP
jgi:hypothetical protein